MEPTFTESQRRVIWDYIDELVLDMEDLKGIVQNAVPISKEDLTTWSDKMNRLINNLKNMDINIKNIINNKIV